MSTDAHIYINTTDWTVTTTSIFSENYSPIQSAHDSGYYRVLIEQVQSIYTVHTGDNMTRILREQELPKEIRVKLTMIKAYETDKREEWSERDYTMTSTKIYVWSPMDMYSNSTFPIEFNDIGWRCRTDGPREFYCVITSAETLDSLRGEPL